MEHKHIIDLSHMSRHNASVTLVIGGVIVLVCGLYSANIWGIAYKISINVMGSDSEHYHGAVAGVRVVAGMFALIGLYMVVKALSVVVG